MPRTQPFRLTIEEKDFILKKRRLENEKITKEVNKDGLLEITSNQITTLNQLVKRADIKLDEWEVKRFIANKWDVTMKINNTPILRENWQVKAFLEKKLNIEDISKFKHELSCVARRLSPKLKPTLKETLSGNMLEIMIPDLHLGKMSWGKETGGMDYDIKIAVNRYWKAFNDLINMSMHHDIDEVVFIVGNDLFNSDNNYPITTTTAGTPQQDDTRWQKVFQIGRSLMIDSILLIKQKLECKINVLIIPGNHDFQKSFYLGDLLSVKFDGDQNVSVDNSPKTRKYFGWGDNLIGFAHGNRKDEGEKRLSTLMQVEVPELWAKSKYREWHLGDIHHHKKVTIDEEDVQGIILRYLKTLMYSDEWEARKGYYSQKGAHCFIWNKQRGMIAQYQFNN